MGKPKRRDKKVQIRNKLKKHTKPTGKGKCSAVHSKLLEGKSVREGYMRLGIAHRTAPEAGKPSVRLVEETIEPQNPEEVLFPQMEEVSQDIPLYEGQRTFAERAIAKHGDDYEAMARDLKLNELQHTAGRLRRICRLYLKEVARKNASQGV